MTDHASAPHPGAGEEEREPTPCAECGGAGMVPVGERFVTRDMAIDAGDRAMEGMSCGVEMGPCDACGGGGLQEPADSEASARLRTLEAERQKDYEAWLSLIYLDPDKQGRTWRDAYQVAERDLASLRSVVQRQQEEIERHVRDKDVLHKLACDRAQEICDLESRLETEDI